MNGECDRYHRVLDLAAQVYDAALDDQLWASLEPKITETFNVTSFALVVRDSTYASWICRSGNFDDKIAAAYGSHYHRLDVWVERAVQKGLGQVSASTDLIGDDELMRTEFYNDWCRPAGVFYAVGSVVPLAERTLGIIAMQRPQAAPTFEEDDKALVRAFAPHFKRALQIRQRLAEGAIERAAALDTLERSATATVVATGDGRVLYANREGERLLHEADGLCTIGGRIGATDRATSARLAALVRESAGTAAGKAGGAGGALAIARADRLSLSVLVAPFRPARDGFGSPLPAAILFIRDPEVPPPKSVALCGLFGLTPAEARIAAALAEGNSLEETATTVGISLNTARTQLKSVFAKTGTSRQAELVSFLLRSAAPLARP